MTDIQKIEALLGQMRRGFLSELGERCDALENLIISLEHTPRFKDVFEELYRNVHSLKGAGGTHGLHFLTAICHQFESHLTEASGGNTLLPAFFTTALAYVDLLRQVEVEARRDDPDYARLEAELEKLRFKDRKRLFEVLLAEPSSIMQHLVRKALADQPARLTVVEDGITAIETLVRQTFDVAVVARELVRLNGIAVVAAIRASGGNNATTPFVLITSNPDSVPLHTGISKVLARDKNLIDDVVRTLMEVINSKPESHA